MLRLRRATEYFLRFLGDNEATEAFVDGLENGKKQKP
jgi:hypothetical protein